MSPKTYKRAELYRLRRREKGLLFMEHYKYGNQIWVKARFRSGRVQKECALCRCELPSKATGYRPITNGYNRMHRICEPCGDGMPVTSPRTR